MNIRKERYLAVLLFALLVLSGCAARRETVPDNVPPSAPEAPYTAAPDAAPVAPAPEPAPEPAPAPAPAPEPEYVPQYEEVKYYLVSDGTIFYDGASLDAYMEQQYLAGNTTLSYSYVTEYVQVN